MQTDQLSNALNQILAGIADLKRGHGSLLGSVGRAAGEQIARAVGAFTGISGGTAMEHADEGGHNAKAYTRILGGTGPAIDDAPAQQKPAFDLKALVARNARRVAAAGGKSMQFEPPPVPGEQLGKASEALTSEMAGGSGKGFSSILAAPPASGAELAAPLATPLAGGAAASGFPPAMLAAAVAMGIKNTAAAGQSGISSMEKAAGGDLGGAASDAVNVMPTMKLLRSLPVISDMEALGKAMAGLPSRVEEFGKSLLDSQMYLKRFSADFANLDARMTYQQNRLNVSMGSNTGASATYAGNQWMQLHEDLQIFKEIAAIAKNYISGAIASSVDTAIKGAEVITGLNNVLNVMRAIHRAQTDAKVAGFQAAISDIANNQWGKPRVAEPMVPGKQGNAVPQPGAGAHGGIGRRDHAGMIKAARAERAHAQSMAAFRRKEPEPAAAAPARDAQFTAGAATSTESLDEG